MRKSEEYTWLLYGLAVIVLLHSQVVRLEAETFYVDPISGNMSNDGSYDYPWETLQAVFDNKLIETRVYETLPPGPNTPFVIKNAGAPVKAGDTILLRSGYHGGINYKGAFNSDYITIAAQEGHTPYLKRIRLISVSKWILRGLTVSPEPASKDERLKKQVLIFVVTDKLFGASDDIIVENNNLFSVEDSTPWTTFDLSKDGSVNLKDFAILALYWQDNQCEQSDSCAGSDFDNNGIVNSTDLAIFSNNWLDDWNTLSCRGIQLHSSNSIVRNNTLKNVEFGIVAAGDNIIVERNEIENIAGDGIVGSGDNLTIQYNTVKNFYQVNANHDDMIQFHRGGDKSTPIYNAVIRGNYFISVAAGETNPLLKVQTQGISAFDNDCPYIGWLVENNVVITQHGNAITLGGAQDSIIVNNIIFDPTGRSSARISLGGIYDWKPDVPIETGIWTHVALTCDGSTITMYKNGVNVATTRGWGDLMLADPSSDESFYIGQNTAWGEYFNGIIDEVRVYNRALSETEIAQLYAPPQVVTVPSVVGMVQAAAQSAIISASLTVGTISHAYSMTVPAGDIISQAPVAGTSVIINSAVDLVVSDGPQMVTAPNVVGMPQASAQSAIISASLTVGTISYAYSMTVPAGDIISQDPAAGTSVVINSAIDLVVSDGPQMVTAPNVVGMAQAAAQSAIISASLTIGTISHAYSMTVPAGDIISQDPAAGTSVVINSTIDLVVSDGPQMVTVPNLVGMAQANAESAIISASLTVGTISHAYSMTVPAGDIISHDPTAGTSVLINSAVDLVVSDGPQMVTVPNVVGMAQANAESAIISVSLTVGTISHAYSTTVPAGDIISQNPAAGTSVVINSAINLVVSDGPQMVTVPSVVGMAQAAAQSAIVSASLNVGAISHAYNITVPAGDIISQDPAAGTSVVINSAVDLVVSDGKPPVLEMKFDEGTGTTAADSSGNGNHGTLINGPVWTTGQVNGGLTFDGSNDYVEVPDDPSFDIVDEITIAAWINPTDAIAFRTILSKFAHTPDYRKDLYWFLHNGRIGASLAGPSGIPGRDWRPDVPIEVGVWMHVALTYNGSVMTMYKDGVDAAAINLGGALMVADSSSDEPFYVGQNTQWGEYFYGIIDEVRVYDRALSVSEIAQLYVPPQMVTVPNVVGMVQANAESAIISASLTVGTISHAYSMTVPAGDIISQDPAVGTSVLIDSAVDLVVSDGPQMITVPNVVGMAQAAAESAIISASLTVGTISHAYSTTVPAGDIISHDPTAGTSVLINSAVDLVVSDGPQMITAPNVVGMTQADAQSAIISASLTVGTISHAYSMTVPAGDIISQNPAAGTSVVINSAIDLVVSDGPQMVTVPNVVGMVQANAESAIISASLTVGTISHAYSIIVPAGDIISQAPAAGTSVVINSTIDLVVSDGPEMVTVPSVVGMAQANAESDIISASLTVGTISHAFSITVPAGDIISQAPAAGTSVVINSAIDLVVSNGPQMITVPDVVGMAEVAAQSAIISASLNVGAISHASSTTVPAGYIISQNPAAGVSVVINSAVDLVVSDGASPDLILDMRFDEGTGTIAGDSSDNANYGMLINGPIWTTGQVNGGLSFDGSNDYVEVTDDPSFDIVDEITIAAWINPADANTFRTILSKFAHTPDYRKDLYWFLYNGRIGASLAGPSGGGKNVVVRNNMAYSFHLLGENIMAGHNIDINDYDPNALFVNWENLNLRHRHGSPSIDAGRSKLASGIDIDDISRPYGRAHDIGAYEYTLLCDINRDGTVNFKDYAILAYHWHDNACWQSDLCRVCDFNQDEIVDFNDLIIFVNQWLEGRTLLFDSNNDGIVNFLDYAIFASYWWDDNCEQSDWCRGADYDFNGMLDFDDLTFFADSWLIE